MPPATAPQNRPHATHTSTEVRGGHAGDLRRANIERIQAFAMDHSGPFTRTELIRATGLSAPTVGSLVRHLIGRGLVLDAGAGPSRGGRRPIFMEFNAAYGFVAAIALGAGPTQLAVGDLRGECLAHRSIPTPRDLEPPALLERIAAALRSLLRDSGVPDERLLAVCAASPGLVDRETGTVVALAPGLVHWSNVTVGPILTGELGVPVRVENDVNLAVVGEHWKGAARGHDTCAYIHVGTGIGAGILIDGRLHRGHHLMAGEIAFMCMAPRHVDEDFGDRGCLETLAGLDALATRSSRARGDGDGWVADLYDAVARGRAGGRGGRRGGGDTRRHRGRQPEPRHRPVAGRGRGCPPPPGQPVRRAGAAHDGPHPSQAHPDRRVGPRRGGGAVGRPAHGHGPRARAAAAGD